MRICLVFLLACGSGGALGGGTPSRIGSTPASPDMPNTMMDVPVVSSPTSPTGPTGAAPDDEPEVPVFQDGSVAAPFIINAKHLPLGITDKRDTKALSGSVIDAYPPNTQDESGGEFVYAIDVKVPSHLGASLVTPETTGTDIDLHVLSSLSPVTTITRGDARVHATLQPGRYYLVADTYAKKAGVFTLNVMLSAVEQNPAQYFNAYVLKAVDYLNSNYRLLGYDAKVLTHDITYGALGTVPRIGDGHTMCVAAVMEVILTAMQIYANETGDTGIWNHLPIDSWERQSGATIKGHLWVDDKITSAGTPDAVRHFGMGQNIPFEELRPGSFIGINRTTGTGHAVVFLAFLDAQGNELTSYADGVVGFKYFSAQGSFTVGVGGLDFRYALFDGNDYPMPGKRDTHVIRSTDQHYFNTGAMFHPSLWMPTSYTMSTTTNDAPVTFDPSRFDGQTPGE